MRDKDANPQLNMYGAAAYREHDLAGEIKRVRTVIVQPRINHISERVQTVQEIEEFILDVAHAAAACALPDAPRVPSTKGCRWCRAKATCTAIQAQVTEAFESVDKAEVGSASDDTLAAAMAKTELIEGWIKAVRGEVERRLVSGIPVPGYKLVQGKAGHRKWSSQDEAEATLKSMRVPHDRMYDYSLVSPTTVEKLFKEGVVGPRQWPKLQPLITQSKGSPSVAPASDKRPAIEVTSASASDFDDVTDLA